ncbi:hypothetical protein DNL40_08905 [Xylanimonas oleitrophica]|uniref:Bacterial spore germination immunoglobulin-like domain-containing protein n=1 Tax=Xylanimonas oleitrophica TaxID=2607479 RepID=A0A2W5WQ86_9MICO|nr:hypothetical protein [Xylanimonas oleitrophica]PZR53112.1 hypothetical protein DNL40_08905 [Xylanimonas oleitrophica]
MHRRLWMAAAALMMVAGTAAGCGGPTEPAPGSAASCTAPELRWTEPTARAGDDVLLEGAHLLTGCDDTGADGTQDGDAAPLTGLTVTLLTDGAPYEPQPEQPQPFTAEPDGTFRAQMFVPDVDPGTELEVEMTADDGAVVRSDVLTVVE